MNSRESSRGREGMIGNGERRRGVLDLDLNYPPPAEDLTQRYPIMGHANGFYQDQVANRVELGDGDDNVLTIFPRSFAEITRNARTGEEVKYEYHTDWLLITDLGFATFDELRALSASEGSNRTHDLPVRTVPPVSSLTTSQQDTPTFTCGICLDQLTEETTTKCGHIFCRVCIDAAILRQRKCPTCRQKLGRRDTIRIYLPNSN